jgi:hypothetical protein
LNFVYTSFLYAYVSLQCFIMSLLRRQQLYQESKNISPHLGKTLNIQRGMLGDHRKHKENFEKFHFHLQKLFLLNISVNSLHKNVSTRNTRQHQTMFTRNKPMQQTVSTRNKPKHQNASTQKKSYFVPSRHNLVQNITRILPEYYQICLILRVKIKFCCGHLTSPFHI